MSTDKHEISKIPSDRGGVFMKLTKPMIMNDKAIGHDYEKNKNRFTDKIIYINVQRFKDPGNITNDELGTLLRFLNTRPSIFRNIYKDFKFIFCNDLGQSFVLHVNQYKSSEFQIVCNLIKTLNNTPSIRGITGLDKTYSVIQVHDPKQEEEDIINGSREEFVSRLSQAAKAAGDEEEVMEILSNDEYVQKIARELADSSKEGPKISNTRSSRITKLNDDFLNTKVNNNITIKDIINGKTAVEKLPSTEIKVHSINDEWKDMKFINFEEVYDLHGDIIKCINTLSSKIYPISIRNVDVEDISNNQDYIYTYRIALEDFTGKRSTLTVDLPKFKDKRFMRLRGNDKVMSGQLLLLPCTKSDSDTVQLVSFYNKIFVRRKGQFKKSYPASDRLTKTLKKLDGKKSLSNSTKVYFGDNSKICSKYELPIDYIDIASSITKIVTSEKIYYFDQDIYRTQYKINVSKGMPYAVNKYTGEIYYYKQEDEIETISYKIADELCNTCEEFGEIYSSIKASNTLNYSEASVLAAKIPLIIVLGLGLGLTETLNRAGIELTEIKKKKKEDDNNENKKNNNEENKEEVLDPDVYGIIKFADKKMKYKITYSSSMLLNGLSKCDTEFYDYDDMDKKATWLDFLDNFGGRLLSDGLENFQESFLDPITQEVCRTCRLPDNYYDMLIYANNILSDNKYIKHTDITGNRFRSNEQIAQLFYKSLCNAYESYKLQTKRGRKVTISMKRSVVIDAILTNSTTSDLSILNPLFELESANTISFKGPSGMNSDRAYGLDKRCYDDSMLNKIALSNSFAGNIGISRWATMDMDIEGTRGYVKDTGLDEMSVTKSLCVTEAVTPFGVTRETI